MDYQNAKKEKENGLDIDIIKNIDENELSPKDYSTEIEKLIEVQKYLMNINKKYFNNKEIIHNYIKITFNTDCDECEINYGDEEKIKLKNVKGKTNFYLKKKEHGKIIIEAIIKKHKKENYSKFKKEECQFKNIDENFAKAEFEKSQKEIKLIVKEKPKDINVILTINKNQKINTKDENFKNLLKIMGESGLKKQLKKGIDIINKNDYSIDNIKSIIKELEKYYNLLKDLEFNTPKFENGLGYSTRTNNYCDKYKNEFKDMIIGKLQSLVNFYNNFDLLRKKAKKNIESFNKAFSVVKFEKKDQNQLN